MESGDDVQGPINLGNPGEFTIAELAREVVAAVGEDPGIDFFPLPQDDPMQRKPDITRARESLGWEPKVPLAEGLRPTIDQLRERVAEAAEGR